VLETLIGFTIRKIAEVDQDVWSAEPEVVRGLVPDSRALLSANDLETLLDRHGQNPIDATVVLNQAVVPDERFPDRAELDAFRTQGATIMLPALQRYLPVIRDLCKQLMAATQIPSFGNAYLTPPRNQGFDIHWDLGSVMVVQVWGTKTWVLRRPVVTTTEELNTPWSVRGFKDGELDGEPYLTVTLNPGDALFVPRGWVHFAHATDQESLHVSIGALHQGIDLESCSTVYP
jgi:lysine-specific demethylase/histidyl-hydroxylase NO66